MLRINRHRPVYGLLTVGVLLTGLASRRFFGDIPFIQTYAGDVLWTLMVFFGLAFIFTKWSAKAITMAAWLFSVSIELSQLYHVPWIDALRNTRLGGLVLGFAFVWSDLICYTAGAVIGLLAETYLVPTRYRGKLVNNSSLPVK